jgi:riboflavin kinase/FMN adenylyltransferase
MHVIDPTEPPRPPRSSIVTVGVYDGVHLGHQRTLARVVADARAEDRAAIVATFDRHPLEVVRPDLAPKLLCTLEQRLERLAEVGIDAVSVIAFDAARSREEATAFIADELVARLGAARVVVGQDFRFGRDRAGDLGTLAAAGERLGFDVEGVVLGEADGEAISSTRIRQQIAQGDVAGASLLLGRLHEVVGEVCHGDGRGGPELGFPTANLHVPTTMAIPAVGIYAGFYADDTVGQVPAAISVGRRPTFYESADPLIEAHLLDFNGDLYGRQARISFLAHLRDEARFESVADLVAQMAIDVERTARLCAAGA